MKIKNEELSGRIQQLHKDYELEFHYFNKPSSIDNLIKSIEINVKNSISVDIETTGLDIIRDRMLGIVIGLNTKKALYISVRDWNEDDIVYLIKSINSLPNKKIMHNMHFDMSFTGARYNIQLHADYDTMIYAYCLFTEFVYNKISISLKEMTRRFLPYGDYEADLLDFKKQYTKEHKMKQEDFSYELIPEDMLSAYACMDGIATLVLFNKFMKKKIEEVNKGWEKLDSLLELKHKVTYVYNKIKINGFTIDRDMVKKLHSEWSEKIDIILKELLSMKEIKISESIIKRKILKKAQEKRKSLLPLTRCRKLWKESNFNFNSSDHLKILFYEVLKLPVTKKTDKGEPSTDSEVIENFASQGIEFMTKLNEYSTYVKGIDGFLGIDTGKGLWKFTDDNHSIVHSNYNHCGTVSSRVACTEPNKSQVPSRGELKKIKKCYVARKDYNILGFDK